jgi:hypothetical protein
LNFSYKEKYINEIDYSKGNTMVEEIGAMLWREVDNLDKHIKG